MAKLISALRAPAGVERRAFQSALLQTARAGSSASDTLERLVLDIVDIEPAGAPSPRYDAVVQVSRVDATEQAPSLDFPAGTTVHSYLVSERVQLAPPGARVPGRRQGVKAIYLVRRRSNLNDNEARARWQSHAGTARRHHAGMVEYVQNGVIRALTGDAPLVHGIAELHFPTLADLEERLYDSEEGRRAVEADVAGLVEEAMPLYATEYVFL